MIDLTRFWQENPQYNGVYKEQGVYGITYTPLAASAVQQQGDFTVGNDHDFIITAAYGSQTTSVTNAAFILTPLLMTFVFSAYSRLVSNVKLEWNNLLGTPATYSPAQFWTYPIIVPAAAQFSTIVDNPLAVASNVWIGFQGIKAFPGLKAGRQRAS